MDAVRITTKNGFKYEGIVTFVDRTNRIVRIVTDAGNVMTFSYDDIAKREYL